MPKNNKSESQNRTKTTSWLDKVFYLTAGCLIIFVFFIHPNMKASNLSTSTRATPDCTEVELRLQQEVIDASKKGLEAEIRLLDVEKRLVEADKKLIAAKTDSTTTAESSSSTLDANKAEVEAEERAVAFEKRAVEAEVKILELEKSIKATTALRGSSSSVSSSSGDKCDVNKQTQTFAFDGLGPVGKCNKIVSFGKNDDEKRLCVDDVNFDECLIFSLGSNDQWQFEEAIFDNTNCQVHTFDCTGNFHVPSRIKERVTLHKICIGSEPAPMFLNWDEVVGQFGKPDYLKMDIEGWEWSVLHQIAESKIKPGQIAVEIHLCSYFMPSNNPGKPWTKTNFKAAYKIPGATTYYKISHPREHISKLMNSLAMDLIDRHDNPYCPHCSEVLLRSSILK